MVIMVMMILMLWTIFVLINRMTMIILVLR